jgi:hypothetical protein
MRLRNIFWVILIAVLLSPFVLAKDITMGLDQKEYYFKTGEEAIIPLAIDNNYGKSIDGMFSYTYTQEVNNAGMHFSSSNTQSKSFSVVDGKSNVSLNFGSSDSPMDLRVNMLFSYNDGSEKQVSLESILIHFVSDDSQKNNQPQKVTSSSQKVQGQQNAGQGQNQEDNFLSKAQQMIQQMQGQQSNPASSTQSGKLQNNQMGQDSNALKKQMQQDAAQQEQMKKEFQEVLSQNQELGKNNEEMMQQGYQLESGSVNPESNNTGSFQLNYKNNQTGESATVSGKIENKTLKSLVTDSPEERQKALAKLAGNKQYSDYKSKLEKEGFKQQGNEFMFEQNKTIVTSNFVDANNQTAKIESNIVNGSISSVVMQKDENAADYRFYLFIAVLILILLVASYFIYKKYYKKIRKEIVNEIAPFIAPVFDHKKEARELIEKAKKKYKEKEFKDAYSFASRAVRLFLSYENGLKKELTNDEIVHFYKQHKKEHKTLKEFLDLCCLVEFAKYKANDDDFNEIVRFAEKTIDIQTL